MEFSEFLQPQAIAVDLQPHTKAEAIDAMVDLLARSPVVTDRQQLLVAILEREGTMSTGIGNGVAIPHGKSDGVTAVAAAIGLVKKGVDFDALDGQRVYILVLLAAPPGPAGPHIRALGRVSRLVNQAAFRKALLECESSEAIRALIAAEEKRLG